jgi:hypothetical protein
MDLVSSAQGLRICRDLGCAKVAQGLLYTAGFIGDFPDGMGVAYDLSNKMGWWRGGVSLRPECKPCAEFYYEEVEESVAVGRGGRGFVHGNGERAGSP